jgi:hypothetical protein
VSDVLVDSSVLLDVLGGDGAWRQWSERAIASAAETARLLEPISKSFEEDEEAGELQVSRPGNFTAGLS